MGSSQNSTPRPAGLAIALVLTIGASLSGNCYKPHIGPTLQCAELPSKQCPDNYECQGGLCEPVGGLGGMTGGSGGAAGMCANPIASLCPSTSNPNPNAQPCDHFCQRGCGCGLRCGSNAGIACLANTGSKGEGEVCNLSADDCAPGFVCHQERCGNNLGRCYRFCLDHPDCPATVCGTVIPLKDGTTAKGCNLGEHLCDARTGDGCPDAALICYATSRGHTTCDCPSGGSLTEGQDCMNDYTACLPGLICIGETGDPVTRCHKLCATAAECPSCDGFLCPLQ